MSELRYSSKTEVAISDHNSPCGYKHPRDSNWDLYTETFSVFSNLHLNILLNIFPCFLIILISRDIIYLFICQADQSFFPLIFWTCISLVFLLAEFFFYSVFNVFIVDVKNRMQFITEKLFYINRMVCFYFFRILNYVKIQSSKYENHNLSFWYYVVTRSLILYKAVRNLCSPILHLMELSYFENSHLWFFRC